MRENNPWKDYLILIPNMAFNQFTLIQAALESEGYHTELLSTNTVSYTHLRAHET